MAHVSNLPCDGEGICMRCNSKPPQEETLTCKTCATPWHLACLLSPPESHSSALEWDCPDCSQTGGDGDGAGDAPPPIPVGRAAESSQLVAAIREIERDESLTEQEKARKRQRLLSKGKGKVEDEDSSDLDEAEKKKKGKGGDNNDVLDLLDDNFNCSFCMKLPERPVTTPCGHNFCLKCFEKWTGQGKRSCVKCRSPIPPKMATQPRINSSLVAAIRLAKMSKNPTSDTHGKVYHFLHNQQRPDKAFTTERAKKAGKANACSGKIFVTVPPDHFGPILAENDPVENKGVLVGKCWEDRMECRQWGAHLPHIAGIAGQSEYGSQSVALSGGYVDDEDHGEWFLYTGSGGRDLSGNKRTNKEQSSDQKFEKLNEALRVSCKKGYPVRVVRSHKEKRSSYAPEKGVRYDGVYRIEKCWRKVGVQGYKVCRYLFVRCDNEPAPWTSDVHGDHPRPLPVIKELKTAIDVTERKETPAWDYDDESSTWKWKKSPPLSRRSVDTQNPEDRKRTRKATQHTKKMSVRDNLLKEFSCLICRKVLNHPVTTPCAHNFCKHCLEGAFSGQSFVRERTCAGRRTLRSRKNIMKCPVCPADISDFLQNPQVNRELMGAIESLQKKPEEENVEALGEADEGENVEALGEAESGDSDEQSGSLCENSGPERQDDTRTVQNPSEQKSKRLYKRRKVNEDALISKTDSIEKMENSSEEQKFENLTGDNEDEEVDNSVPKPVNNPNTVGGEIIKVSDEVANEAKDSPSSPHHVGSEVDDME